jgi:hypothetical protein
MEIITLILIITLANLPSSYPLPIVHHRSVTATMVNGKIRLAEDVPAPFYQEITATKMMPLECDPQGTCVLN